MEGMPARAVTVDEVPFSVGPGTIGALPDIDPGDLARIEVLRGPQGTLYGASSMGGLVRYVTVDPSTDAVSGRVRGLEVGANWQLVARVRTILRRLPLRESSFFA